MNKYFIFVCLASFSTSLAWAQPKILTNFNELTKSLEQGNNVKAIIDVTKCQTNSTDFIPGSTSINFTYFSHYKMNKNNQAIEGVGTSYNRLSLHPQYGLTNIYERVAVYSDNSVDFRVDFYNLRSFALIQSTEWTCAFDKVFFKQM